jgi:hypothetical protein
MSHSAVTRGVTSEADAVAIHSQLERLFASPFFKNSKRCVTFLDYVTEGALRGESQKLKERTLGIDVFERKPDYDTNLDPVVRTTANEVRKRLAQYYDGGGHEAEIRIDLPAGSYIPEFRVPENGTVAPAHPPFELVNSGIPTKQITIFQHGRLLLSLSLVALIATLAVLWTRPWAPTPVLDQFWNPVLGSPNPVLVSVGEPTLFTTASSEPNPSVATHVLSGDHVALSDVVALSRLVGLLSRKNKEYRVLGAGSTTFTDLRNGPTVLIAGLDNPWTMRALAANRFQLVPSAESRKYRIQDRENSAQQDWLVDFSQPYSSLTQDYAIVARFLDQATGQVVVIAAGIGENGTIAAGEFLTQNQYLEALTSKAPKDWAHKNIEAVIATQVIEGKSGPPRVVAVHSW